MARERTALTIHPVTADRWSDLETLFGERGACGGCWCMYWRRSRSEFEAGKAASNRAALLRLVQAEPAPGLLAYEGAKPIAWCAVGPRDAFPTLLRSRILKPVDERPVWSVTCLFVARDHRGHGLQSHLLEAAAAFARRNGARAIEGYPVEPRARMADAFVWTGIASAFERAGFREVARRSPTRPIVRRELRRR